MSMGLWAPLLIRYHISASGWNRKGHQYVDAEIDYDYGGWDGREKKTLRYCALVVKKNRATKRMGVQIKEACYASSSLPVYYIWVLFFTVFLHIN